MRSSLALLALAASVAGCTTVTDGIEVDVAYLSPATPQAVWTDSGYRVWLDRALIVVGPVELVQCDNYARLLWQLFTPGRARAHAPATPTSLGVPFVLDLMESTGSGFFAGTIRPPPGRYCGLRVTGAPADQDAEGLKNNEEMLESTVLITGEIEDIATLERVPFGVSVREPLIQELWFDAPLVFDSPKSVSVSVHIDHTSWFDGIDFAAREGASLQQDLARNIGLSMAAERL